MTEQIYRDMKTAAGNMRVTIFADATGNVLITKYGSCMVSISITREDVMQLGKAIEEIVAEYDAGCDRYHDVCDEPVTAGAH